jgi:hypothetical protein
MKLSKIKFGRLVEFDPQSRDYPIRTFFWKGIKPRSYTWRCSVNLNQGDAPACVGFSWTHEAIARPVEIKSLTNKDALALYKLAQTLDDYPGEDYDGTSVLGGAKAQQQKKRLGSYFWAFSESELALAIGYKGPAVLGVNWYSGMMDPDSKGIIKPVGQIEGGHAILCTGISIKTGFYRLHNSWGKDWGYGGDCFISRTNLAKLLKEDGEVCIPTVRLKG